MSERRFHMFYQHDDCPVQPRIWWEQEWSCACNDKCPACNREIEPYYYEDAEVYRAYHDDEAEE